MIAEIMGSERGGECDERHTIGDKWDGTNYPRIASKSNWTANIPSPRQVHSIPEILKNGLGSQNAKQIACTSLPYEKIKLLKNLAEGCRKHPAYRGRRPETQRCPECVVVWNARLELNDMSGELETTVDQYWNMMFPCQ